MTFQRARVNKALGSVSQICKNGNRVIFDTGGSYIQNKETGSKLWLKEQGGVFVLPMMVGPPSEIDR